MPNEKTRIYILGRTQLDEDEDEAIRDIGGGIYLLGKQLVTAKNVQGVAQAAAWGFRDAGGEPEYIGIGQVPDSENVFIFADRDYKERVENKIPDWQERGWLFIMDSTGLFEFHHAFLTVMNEKGLALPKHGGGGSVGSPSGRGRPHRTRR